MGIKDKLFGGPQNPQQPKVAEEIVNPYYNIAQDGSVSSSASSFVPSAAPNPFMQFQQQQQQTPFQQPQQPQQAPQQAPQPQQPVMNNNDRFDMAQPDQPNAYYAASPAPAEDVTTPVAAPAAAPAAEGWTCSCGQTGNTNRFCVNCGRTKPEPAAEPAPAPAEDVTTPVAAPAEAPAEAPAAEGWTCSCGQTGNMNRFCINCGRTKPEPAAEPAPAPAEDVTTPVAAPAAAPAAEGWTCSCGQTGNMNRFCINCGRTKPEPAAEPAPAPAAEGWTCSCGQTGNMNRFCINCGGVKPEPAAEPAPAPAEDVTTPVAAPAEAPAAEGWTCSCGQTGNMNRFCINCGGLKPEPAAEPAPAPAEDVTTPVAAPAAAPAAEGWTCSCGQTGNKYQFCINCGATQPGNAANQFVPEPRDPNIAINPNFMGAAAAPPQPPVSVQESAPQAEGGTWSCECGFTGNTGRFCLNCGSQRPF